MSETLEDGIKRWTAKRKSALVGEIIQGKTTVAEASRSYDLAPLRSNWLGKSPSVPVASCEESQMGNAGLGAAPP